MRRFLLLVVFALAAGGAASYLSVAYLRSLAVPEAPAPAAAPTLQFVVAARDLASGTVLSAADLRLAEWQGATLPAVLTPAPDDLVGRTVLHTIGAGEPVIGAVLAVADAGPGVAGMVPRGMRAVSVPVDPVVGVNGFVLPRTRVDVLATLDRAGGEPETRLVLQDVEALAAGHALQPDADGTPQSVAVVTLLVTPEQAQRLVLAMHRGRLQLALRNRLDQEQLPATAVPVTRPRAAAAPRPVPAAVESHSVEVYRGTTRSVVDVNPGARGSR